jgi:hypothetical protein
MDSEVNRALPKTLDIRYVVSSQKNITTSPTLSTLQSPVKSKSPGKKGSSNMREYFFWNSSPKYSTNAQAHIKSLNEDPSHKKTALFMIAMIRKKKTN